MILAIRHEYDEMGKALMCPICRSTLREAIILPCVHAFCNACLKDYYNPPRPPPGPRNGRKGASSPPRKPKAECPVCKSANPGKRSGEKCPHLDELTRAYKMIGRAFSFAPVRYAADVVMTQLDPRDNFGRSEDSDSDEEEEEVEEDRKMSARKRISTVHDYEQHLLVAKAVHDAFVEKAESQSHPSFGRREELENQLKVRRYHQLAKEQEAVVRADEQALNRVVKRLGGKKRTVATVTAAFAAEVESVNINDAVSSSASKKKDLVSKKASAGAVSGKSEFAATSTVLVDDLETKNIGDASAADKTFLGEMDAGVRAEEFDKSKMGEVEVAFKDKLNVDEDAFCTAPDESQAVEYYTAREESQVTSSLKISAISSPAIIHDGNTAKKADQLKRLKRSPGTSLGANVHDSESSPESSMRNGRESTAIESSKRNFRESMATAATASNSPIVLHDGNTVRKTYQKHKPNHGVSFLDSDIVDDPIPWRPGKLSTLPSVDGASVMEAAVNTDADVASNGDGGIGGINNFSSPRLGKPAVASVCQAEQLRPIAKGTIVFVQARTWPGINKPGGVARVTKVHPAAESGGNSTKFDVAYVLGGKENQVDESFVTLNEIAEPSTIEECPENLMTTESMSAEKKRPTRHRRAATKPVPPVASFPIYNDEELKHIPEDVLKWAGIVPKEKKKEKRKMHQAPGSPSKHNASKGKKRVLKESNIPKSNSTKKQKPTAEEAVKSSNSNNRPNTVEGFRDLIRFMSNEEIVSLADARYSHLLSLDKRRSTSETHSTLHVVTSGLTDKESEMLDSLCQVLKGKSVILKVTKDPEKSQICITASAPPSSENYGPTDVISQSRTLKVMRSALAGIPILTPRWMEACLKEGRLVAPSGIMCVRSLPMKKTSTAGGELDQNGPEERFGVAKYAASFHKMGLTSSNHLLSGIAVMLCGNSAGSATTKDLKVLLHHTGATIVGSVSVASRLLADISKGGTRLGPFVFLCDDSPTDKTCGMSDALFRQAQRLARESIESEEGKRSVLCVHFSWLFDSISCASPMKADAYEPLVWKMAMESQSASTSNMKDSQIY